MRHQDGAALSLCQRPSRALPHHHLRGRLPRPHARHHRRRRPGEISRGLRPQGRGLRPGAVRRLDAVEKAITPGDRGHPDRAGAGRGRHPPGPGRRPEAAARSCATSMACCWSSTRSSAASAAPASCSPMNGPASRPTSWPSPRASAAASRWAPAWPPTRRPSGMTAGTHGTTFGGNPLAMAVGNAVLDVVLDDGFLDEVSAQGAASEAGARRASPTSSRTCIEAIRGVGLMLGLKCRRAQRRGQCGAARRSTCSPCRPATMSSACCRRSSSPTTRSGSRWSACAKAPPVLAASAENVALKAVGMGIRGSPFHRSVRRFRPPNCAPCSTMRGRARRELKAGSTRQAASPARCWR